MNRRAALALTVVAACGLAAHAQDNSARRVVTTPIHQLGETHWRSINELLCAAFAPDGKVLSSSIG